jgi:hypothetical protein
MRTFRRVCDELDITSMPAKMLRMACARQDRVNHEYQRATRVVERLLQAQGGRQEERRLPVGGGLQDERKYRDEFGAGHVSKQRMEYEDSVPIERRPTLLVAEVLATERQERSLESTTGAGWSRPAMADRGRGIGDLGMAGSSSKRRKGAPAGGGQHTTGWKLRGATPHIFRLFREGRLLAAA